ncbi:hypothetical protein D3C81_2019290 [compost metagenome]
MFRPPNLLCCAIFMFLVANGSELEFSPQANSPPPVPISRDPPDTSQVTSFTWSLLILTFIESSSTTTFDCFGVKFS